MTELPKLSQPPSGLQLQIFEQVLDAVPATLPGTGVPKVTGARAAALRASIAASFGVLRL